MYMYYICIYVRMGGFRGFRMDSESQGFQPLLKFFNAIGKKTLCLIVGILGTVDFIVILNLAKDI